MKLSDRQPTKALLQNIDVLSVNQINASIKLTELWKATYNKECPLKITKPLKYNPMRVHRTRNDCMLAETGKSEVVWSTFTNDGIRLWNSAPMSIKNSDTLYTAKKRDQSICQDVTHLIFTHY